MCCRIARIVVFVSLAFFPSLLLAQGTSTSRSWYSCKQFELEDCEVADLEKIVLESGDVEIFSMLLGLAGKPDQGDREFLDKQFGRAPDIDRQLENGVRRISWVEGDPETKTLRAAATFTTLENRILAINFSRKGRYYLLWSRVAPVISLSRLSEATERRAGLRRLVPQGAADTVRIGLAAPFSFTGFSVLAVDLERGVRLSAEEINARGGIRIGARRVPVELVIGDDKHNPAEAERVAALLVEQRVAAVVGHLTTSASLRANRTYAKRGVPVINPFVTDATFNEEGARNIFRVAPSDDRQAEVLLRYAAEEFKARRVVVLYEAGSYGRRLGEILHFGSSKAGLRQELLHVMSAKPEPLVKLMAEIKEAEPDVIFYSGNGPTAIRLLGALQKAGLNAPVLAVDGACSPKVAETVAPTQRLFCTLPVALLGGAPFGGLFSQKFNRRFGENPSWASASGYDAMTAIADAIEKAASVEAPQVVEALFGSESDGIFGPITFTGGGELVRGGISLFKVDGGKRVWLKNLY